MANKKNYRYHPSRGLRREGEPYSQVDGFEIGSEYYDSLDDFHEAIQLINQAIMDADNEEGNDDE